MMTTRPIAVFAIALCQLSMLLVEGKDEATLKTEIAAFLANVDAGINKDEFVDDIFGTGAKDSLKAMEKKMKDGKDAMKRFFEIWLPQNLQTIKHDITASDLGTTKVDELNGMLTTPYTMYET